MGEGSTILVAVYGALLGARHALEPDHLAAVSTMAAHGSLRTDVLRVSAAWGAGHATVVTVVGILLIVVGRNIPPWLTVRAEFLVALALIVVGAWTLMGVRRHHLHVHSHAHGTQQPAHAHFHIHLHTPGHEMHPLPHGWVRRPIAAYLIGTLHGLTGSGAATALAVLAAPSRGMAMVYLLFFALGSLLGMVAVGLVAVWPMIRLSSRVPRIRLVVQGLAGIGSVVVGLLLIASLL